MSSFLFSCTHTQHITETNHLTSLGIEYGYLVTIISVITKQLYGQYEVTIVNLKVINHFYYLK